MNLPNAAEFPQHARFAASYADMEVVHAFLHNTKGYELCTWNESENAFVPVTKDSEEIIFEFFGIDHAALVQERRVLRGILMDQLASEATDDMFEQMGLLVQEEDEATPGAADDVFKQLDLLIKKEEDDD